MYRDAAKGGRILAWTAMVGAAGFGCSPAGDDSIVGDDVGGEIFDDGAAEDVSPTEVSADATEAATDSLDDARVLDCTWVNDAGNCWRTFVAEVDACLKNPIGATVRGRLATDGKSCTYAASGRTIAFATKALLAGPERDDRDLSVRPKADVDPCLHYVERASINGFVVTSASGTLIYEAVGNDVRVQCPDGSRYRGDALSITRLCGPAVFSGGAPGRTTSSSGGEVRLQLTGMTDVAYACTTTDAGA